jgi:methionyl-tRNA formyltransferase
MLSVPRLYSINVHASLLPEYRGAAPINWAVIDGCDRTGVSVIRMNEKMDGGDVMASAACRIEEDDTAFSLETRLSRMGADLLTDTLGQIKAGRENFVPQDETKFSYARKLAKTDGAIDWTMDAVRINNKVRGVIPWPGAFTGFNGQKINIWKSGVFKGGIPDNVPQGQ